MRKFAAAFTGVLIGLTVLLGAPTAAMASGARHVYAGVYQAFSGTDYIKGLSSNIYVAKPFVDTDSAFSLMEISLQDTATGGAVEVGWAVYPALFGNDNPHLFSCTWKTDNSATPMPGCWTGAGTGTGWFDNSSNATDLTADLGTVASSCNGSSLACVKKFEIKFVSGIGACSFSANGWEIWYDNAKVGCWRGDAWSHSTPSMPVMSTSNLAQAYAEVAYLGTGNPKTDMGNGQYGSGAPLGNTGPAYFGSLTIGQQNPSTLTSSFSVNGGLYEPSAYDVLSSGGSVRTFGAGGPGYKWNGSAWVTPGDIGS